MTADRSPLVQSAGYARTPAERRDLILSRLPEHLDRVTWSAQRIAEHQRRELRTLLRLAAERSPFHASRLAGVDVEHFELSDLASLPVMTKAEMMEDFDRVLTDRTLDLARLEAHLGSTGWDADELPNGAVVMASGGSSGRRGVFAYTTEAIVEFVAGLVRPGMARIVALLGEIPTDPIPMALVGAPSGVHSTRLVPSLFDGALMDVTSISSTDPLDDVIDRVNAAEPLLLQGYPSAIRKLADAKLDGRLRVAPLGVTTSSEPLSESDRARIEEAFGVGVVNTFGASEGLGGSSPPDDPAIVLCSDLCIVELVDQDDRPVPPGVPSAKVLVTNLINPLQPLIRYELTDSFTRLPDSPTDGHLRVQVEGRRDDEFDYRGLTVHPLTFRTAMVKDPSVVEYQIRQTTSGADVSVVARVGFDAVALGAALEAGLRRAGLGDPAVDVRVVTADGLDRHPETGKTKRFVPLPRP